MTVTLGEFRPPASAGLRTSGGDRAVRDLLYGIVIAYENNRPRTLQKRLGPSEIGEPCARKLAYKLAHFPATGRARDPWLAILGTATHAWLAEALAWYNERVGREDWLIEQRVSVSDDIDGSCDAYFVPWALVVDHKIVGKTSFDKYVKDGLPEDYRVQKHAYGLGWARRGYPVRKVAIALYPRWDDLGKRFHVISDEFRPEVAQNALRRVDTVQTVVNRLQPAQDPAQFRRIPRKPGRMCHFCPWNAPGEDTGATCPGNL